MEGPSIHLLAMELQVFAHRKIIDVSGNAHIDKDLLLGQQINDIYAYGKRLIIQCSTHAITIHFLMYGSYRIDSIKSHLVPRLVIHTNKHFVHFYSCSIHMHETSDLKKTLNFAFEILSSQWDSKKVVAAMKKQSNQTIDDVLLDQSIFPGVGNIIKNEVLFLEKTSPYTVISDLPQKKLKEIALQARNFSMKFLGWRKAYELKKHLLIYRKKNCPVCSTLIMRRKTGATHRWSFMCPKCQKI